MRALTLHRPWPWAIFFAGKCIENRDWLPPRDIIGTRIAIHAGKTYDWDGADFIVRRRDGWEPLPREAQEEGIIGTALLVGVVEAMTGTLGAGRLKLVAREWAAKVTTTELCANAPPWFVGRYGWLLDERRALPEPIPCRGMQGLWTVPDAVAAMVAAAEVKGG